LPSWIRIRIKITDPDPDPMVRLNTDPIRIRIRIRNPASENQNLNFQTILLIHTIEKTHILKQSCQSVSVGHFEKKITIGET
jgi:hypothetical protein